MHFKNLVVQLIVFTVLLLLLFPIEAHRCGCHQEKKKCSSADEGATTLTKTSIPTTSTTISASSSICDPVVCGNLQRPYCICFDRDNNNWTKIPYRGGYEQCWMFNSIRYDCYETELCSCRQTTSAACTCSSNQTTHLLSLCAKSICADMDALGAQCECSNISIQTPTCNEMDCNKFSRIKPYCWCTSEENLSGFERPIPKSGSCFDFADVANAGPSGPACMKVEKVCNCLNYPPYGCQCTLQDIPEQDGTRTSVSPQIPTPNTCNAYECVKKSSNIPACLCHRIDDNNDDKHWYVYGFNPLFEGCYNTSTMQCFKYGRVCTCQSNNCVCETYNTIIPKCVVNECAAKSKQAYCLCGPQLNISKQIPPSGDCHDLSHDDFDCARVESKCECKTMLPTSTTMPTWDQFGCYCTDY